MATTPRNRSLGTARPSATSTSDGSAHVPPGPKPSVGATIYSVADRAGVSIATVSRVLQGSTVVSEASPPEGARRGRRSPLRAPGRRAQPGRATSRGLRARAPRADRSLLLRAARWASRRARQSSARASCCCSPTARVTSHAPCGHLATRVDGIGVLGSAAMPPAVARALRGRKPVVIIAGAPADGVDSLDGVERAAAENAHSAEHLTEHLLRPRPHPAALRRRPRRGPRHPRSLRGLRRRAHGSWAHAAPSPCESPFREREGAAVADRVLVGRAQAGCPRLRERRARPVDHEPPAGRRPRRAPRHRRRRLGRRHDLPLRAPRNDDGAPARSTSSGVFAAERLHQRVDGAQPLPAPVVLPTELVLRGSCGCSANCLPRLARHEPCAVPVPVPDPRPHRDSPSTPLPFRVALGTPRK